MGRWVQERDEGGGLGNMNRQVHRGFKPLVDVLGLGMGISDVMTGGPCIDICSKGDGTGWEVSLPPTMHLLIPDHMFDASAECKQYLL